MRAAAKAVALWVALCAALYGMGAFIAWEPNPAAWNASGRAILAWLWLSAAPAAVMAVLSMGVQR